MNRKQYADYLRSAHWMSVKARYRASKFPQACVVCGSVKVELHHRTYIRLGKERMEDLIPLCREHHVEAHRIRAGIDAARAAKGKLRTGSCSVSPLATAKQIAWIRRLGGSPPAEMTKKEAIKMASRLQKQRNRERHQRKMAA